MPDTDDLDFTAPEPSSPRPAPQAAPSAPYKAASSPFYKPEIAERIFRDAGKAERFEAGQQIFAEEEKASAGGIFSRGPSTRMYYLAEGEVALAAGGRTLDTASQGEIFGEMAVISGRPRSASATARSACSAFSLNADELSAALKGKPEFALMLMSVMFDRLRFVAARLSTRRTAIAVRQADTPVFDAALLAQLEAALPRPMLVRHRAGTVIMREGQSGMVMYLVKEGHVAITLGDRVVERIGAGGSFGEMALVDQSPRIANAITDEDCELLAIDRESLLAAVKQQPAFAMAMLRSVADRLRHMNAQLG